MKRQEVVDTLAAHRKELREMGVKSLRLFGSVARDQAAEASDVDLLVEFHRPVGLFEYAHTQRRIQEMLGGVEVDLVLARAVIDELRDRIFAEAVDAL